MRVSVVLRYIGIILLIVALFMLLSAGVSIVYNDPDFRSLLLSALLTALLGAFPMVFVDHTEQITNKEGYCIFVGAWVIASFMGMLPYMMYGDEFSLSPINAWFESVSGYTTTGATILTDIEALPHGLLFWRACTSWLGGVGVVMFALLILPSLGTNKALLANMEMSSIAHHNYHYKASMIARILLFIYVGLTVSATVLLRLSGVDWFDSLTHAMSVAATSGFSTKNASVGAFDSVTVEWIFIVTMLISSIHYGVLFATISGQKNNIFHSEVTRWYLAIVAIVSVCITVNLYASNTYGTMFDAARHAIFQTASLISTTGFATADTNIWPPFAIVLLIFVSIVCGCAGSTSGGIKTDRFLLAIKSLRQRLAMRQHPNAIMRVRVDGHVLDAKLVDTAVVFIVAYFLILLIGTIIGTMCGAGVEVSFTSAIACLGNVGPGFGEVGSLGNYAQLPGVMKFSCSLLMLLGRLEIFGLIQLFFIKWWR